MDACSEDAWMWIVDVDVDACSWMWMWMWMHVHACSCTWMHVQRPVRHLRWSFFPEIVNDAQSFDCSQEWLHFEFMTALNVPLVRASQVSSHSSWLMFPATQDQNWLEQKLYGFVIHPMFFQIWNLIILSLPLYFSAPYTVLLQDLVPLLVCI